MKLKNFHQNRAIGLLIGLVLLVIACACSFGILNSLLACIGCKTIQPPQLAQVGYYKFIMNVLSFSGFMDSYFKSHAIGLDPN